jgi:hypothetical protein
VKVKAELKPRRKSREGHDRAEGQYRTEVEIPDMRRDSIRGCRTGIFGICWSMSKNHRFASRRRRGMCLTSVGIL